MSTSCKTDPLVPTGRSLVVILLLAMANPVSGHVDSPYLPEECGSCHVGHGASGQPMLSRVDEEFCYLCHGSAEERGDMITSGRLSPGSGLKDLEEVFNKPYRHPVVEGSGHSPSEQLPSFSGTRVTHSECVDCHDPHQRLLAGRGESVEVKGYSLGGQYLTNSRYEYEICFKCHSTQLGSTGRDRNLRREFAADVTSQHPVTRSASGRALPSLISALPPEGRLNCSDCHGNDDPGGPAGPHGSNNQFLLTGNYSLDTKSVESSHAYELCYSCHDRYSILGNESFPLHRQHVEGDPLTGQVGTSCYTCHASHASRRNPHLLEFNLLVVNPSESFRRLEYVKLGEESGQCFLSCHGHDHQPGEY